MSKARQPVNNSWGSYLRSSIPFTSGSTRQEIAKAINDDNGKYQEMQLMHKHADIDIEIEIPNETRKVKTQNKATKKAKKKLLYSADSDDKKLKKDTDVKSHEQHKLITVDLQDEIVYLNVLSEPETHNSYWGYFKQWASDHKSGIKWGVGIAGTIFAFAVSAYVYYLLFLSKNNVNNPLIGQDNNNSNGTSYGGNKYSGTSIEDLVTIYNKTASTTTKATGLTTTRPFDEDFKPFHECFKEKATTLKQRIKYCMNKDVSNTNCKKIIERIEQCNKMYIGSGTLNGPSLDNVVIGNNFKFAYCMRGGKPPKLVPFHDPTVNITGSADDYCTSD